MFPYAKVINAAVVERRSFTAALDPATIKLINGEAVWRPVVALNEAFDPATQTRTGPVEVIEPTQVIDLYTVTARPRADIEADVASAISTEAERLIAAGVAIPVIGLFRARTEDISRLTGMLEEARLAEAAMEAVSITFRTSAGATVTVTSSAEIEAIYRAVAGHVAGVLATSAALQDGLAALTDVNLAAFDASDPTHWV